MLNRTLGLLHKYCDGALPAAAADVAAADSQHPLRLAAEEGVAKAAEAYNALAPHLALEATVAVAMRGNLYLEETAPWSDLKKVGGVFFAFHEGRGGWGGFRRNATHTTTVTTTFHNFNNTKITTNTNTRNRAPTIRRRRQAACWWRCWRRRASWPSSWPP